MFVLLSLLSRVLPHQFQRFEGQKGPLYHADTSLDGAARATDG